MSVGARLLCVGALLCLAGAAHGDIIMPDPEPPPKPVTDPAPEGCDRGPEASGPTSTVMVLMAAAVALGLRPARR